MVNQLTHFQPFQKRLILIGFTFTITMVTLFLVLTGCEFFFRYKAGLVSRQKMDPGLLSYHKLYGWHLTPAWKGNHYHHDYTAVYSTNVYGFRGGVDFNKSNANKTIAVVGDSFTFGLGVNNDETFIRYLNSNTRQKNRYLNYSIPGYSTDQQYLLLENKILKDSADMVMLVTYLGNDLFDNMLSFPMQADTAKPYFENREQHLKLKNFPVPRTRKTAAQHKSLLKKLGLAQEGKALRLPFSIQNLLIFQLTQKMLEDNLDFSKDQYKPFYTAVNLYSALLHHIKKACERQGTQLLLVLMPGRSFVERPGSKEAVFQDFFRTEIIKDCRKQGIDLFDLAEILKDEFHITSNSLFFPNDGHLNKDGHEKTGAYLLEKLESTKDP